tara:strand:- start:773 stop:922 length:150 start_codon:yes stop_codon:yes gene_type:complete
MKEPIKQTADEKYFTRLLARKVPPRTKDYRLIVVGRYFGVKSNLLKGMH